MRRVVVVNLRSSDSSFVVNSHVHVLVPLRYRWLPFALGCAPHVGAVLEGVRPTSAAISLACLKHKPSSQSPDGRFAEWNQVVN